MTKKPVLALFGAVAFGFASMSIAPTYAHVPGVELLSGFGTPTIDGVISPGEWDSAGTISFPVNIPLNDGGGTVPGTLLVMNDETNLFLAIEYPHTTVGSDLSFEFDNDHGGGSRENGDDAILFTRTGFSDAFRTNQPPCPAGRPTGSCGFRDTDATVGGVTVIFDGTIDGVGVFSNSPCISVGGQPVDCGSTSVTVFELSHPLDSADDAHDFSLSPGDTVGFSLRLSMARVQPSTLDDFAKTGFPSITGSPLGFADILILAPQFLEVVIDIKPGSDPNSINLSSAGVIPVAILSSETFDATIDLDRDTVSLAGARVNLVGKSNNFLCHEEFVNEDDLLDLVCQVETAQFLIEEGESLAVLEAETFDGTPVSGEDTVRIVP